MKKWFFLIPVLMLVIGALFWRPLVVLGHLAVAYFSSTNAWLAPIKFYGKVVDETGAPVAGAQVKFVCNDVSVAGTSNYYTTTDAGGLFSITGIRGKFLMVTPSKSGYYTSRRDQNGFFYAGENVNFVANSHQPVLFHLLKGTGGVPLIHLTALMGGAKGFRIARDGTPVEVSLMNSKMAAAGQGDIQVQCWTHDREVAQFQNYDWRCRISVPEGGLLLYTNEFPFEAPPDGYQPSDEINMPATMKKGWQSNAKRSYFVKLGNGKYGRLSFEMIAAGDHFFNIESFLNPTGSRNLEPDPKQLFKDLEAYSAAVAGHPQVTK